MEIRTGHLQAALTELLRWAHDSGVELEGIDARSGSLEEAFLDWLARSDEPGPPCRCAAGPRSPHWPES